MKPNQGGLLGLGLVLAVASPSAFAAAEEGLKPIREVFEPAGKYDPAKYGKVAVVQWAPSAPTQVGVSRAVAERIKGENRDTLAEFIKEAAGNGAEMVITSEFGVVGYPDIPELPADEDEYRNREDVAPYTEPVPGPTTNYFGKLAKKLKVYIQIGFAEVDESTDKYYNVAVVLDPNGEIVAKYRKINLFKLETEFLSAGRGITTYDSPFGKVGLVICADIYSSNPLNAYKRAGVDVLALSTSWAQWNTGMENFQAAARQVGAYVLAANQQYFPDSGVINPDGSKQSHIRQTDGIAYGYLPRK